MTTNGQRLAEFAAVEDGAVATTTTAIRALQIIRSKKPSEDDDEEQKHSRRWVYSGLDFRPNAGIIGNLFVEGAFDTEGEEQIMDGGGCRCIRGGLEEALKERRAS